VGETVGYRVRFESKVSSRTRIEVLTEGILTRRLQNDPALEEVGLVIFDEFHERHLHTDLALALALDSQRNLRPDLKLLVMSATLDGKAVAQLLDNAPIVSSEGRTFPVDIRYVPTPNDARIPDIVSDAVLDALQKEAGDVLAFLPGAGEIRRVQETIQARVGQGVDVFPLYGDLPWEQQDRAIQPSAVGRRKVVLATPIAETSLTIDGVRIVVDSGFARVPQFDPASGLTRLALARISRASADQRAGRAGRTAPGVCIRLWGDSVQRGLIPQSIPEIRSADLAPLVLELSAWGVRDPATLTWPDPPPSAAVAQARELLQQLGAVAADGSVTSSGRAMVGLPLHPRLAHMLHEARALHCVGLACDIAALLSERDIIVGDARRSGDFSLRLEALHAYRRQGRGGAQRYSADANACQRIEQASQQYRRFMDVETDEGEAGMEAVLLAFAYPDRVALARAPESPRYLLASGRGARLPEKEMRRPASLVAASMDAGEGEGLIYLSAALSLDELRRYLPASLQTRDVVRWDDSQRAVIVRREERFGELVLGSSALSKPDAEMIRAAMIDGIQRMGLDCLPWTPAVREWQARVLCLREWCPEDGWPDVSDAALATTLSDWLGPYLDGISRRDHLARLDLLDILSAKLDWNQRQRLDAYAPTHIDVPSGSSKRLAYTPGQAPVLAVKLQEMFGLADTPRVAGGRIAVTLHLLSPAQRPIQVTQDLRGFWERTYSEVKKELKGRYPKHPWPDDPWNAVPTARAKRRT
jgi:ATP-dependent helicase HrpB